MKVGDKEADIISLRNGEGKEGERTRKYQYPFVPIPSHFMKKGKKYIRNDHFSLAYLDGLTTEDDKGVRTLHHKAGEFMAQDLLHLI